MPLVIVFVFFIMMSGCATQRQKPINVSNDLLIQEYVIESPFPDVVEIQVPLNPKVKSYWKIETGMADALRTGLAYSNLFGTDRKNTYKIIANFNDMDWTSVAGGFGNFTITLKTHYTLYDSEEKILFETDIRSQNDKYRYHFDDHERFRRALAKSVAANVNQFIDILRNTFGEKVNNGSETSPARKKVHTNDTLAESLEKLSQLHTDGHLSDLEFQQAKEKLLNK